MVGLSFQARVLQVCTLPALTLSLIPPVCGHSGGAQPGTQCWPRVLQYGLRSAQRALQGGCAAALPPAQDTPQPLLLQSDWGPSGPNTTASTTTPTLRLAHFCPSPKSVRRRSVSRAVPGSASLSCVPVGSLQLQSSPHMAPGNTCLPQRPRKALWKSHTST